MDALLRLAAIAKARNYIQLSIELVIPDISLNKAVVPVPEEFILFKFGKHVLNG